MRKRVNTMSNIRIYIPINFPCKTIDRNYMYKCRICGRDSHELLCALHDTPRNRKQHMPWSSSG